MNGSITRIVSVEYERPLPWRKWSIHFYQKTIVEPKWMLYLRVMWLIRACKVHTIPYGVWYDARTNSININRIRRTWCIKRWPYLMRDEYGEEDREIEIEFEYWYEPADPSVGYTTDYPVWEITNAYFTDTGEEYEGDADVWNDDIRQYCCDNPEGG